MEMKTLVRVKHVVQEEILPQPLVALQINVIYHVEMLIDVIVL